MNFLQRSSVIYLVAQNFKFLEGRIMHWVWEQFFLANGIVWLLLYALLFLICVGVVIAEQDQELVRERVRKRRKRE